MLTRAQLFLLLALLPFTGYGQFHIIEQGACRCIYSKTENAYIDSLNRKCNGLDTFKILGRIRNGGRLEAYPEGAKYSVRCFFDGVLLTETEYEYSRMNSKQYFAENVLVKEVNYRNKFYEGIVTTTWYDNEGNSIYAVDSIGGSVRVRRGSTKDHYIDYYYFENGNLSGLGFLNRNNNLPDSLVGFYSNGQVWQYSIKYGEKTLKLQTYDTNGIELDCGDYLNGNGTMRSYMINDYSTNSYLAGVITYKDYLENGLWIALKSNGDTIRVNNYSAGKLDGVCKWYGPDNVLKEVSNYRNGKLHGESIKYKADGAVIKREIFEDGVLLEVIYPAGN